MKYKDPLMNEYGDIIQVERMDAEDTPEDSFDGDMDTKFSLETPEMLGGTEDSAVYHVSDANAGFDMSNYEVLEKLEKKRKVLFIMNIASTAFIVALMVLPMIGRLYRNVAVQYFDRIVVLFAMFPFVLLFGIIFFVGPQLKLRKDFQKDFKTRLVLPILKRHFDRLEYYWQGIFTKEDVKRFGLTAIGNRFRSEDHIRAEYRGVKFDQSDVVIRNKSGKNTYTYFSGRMFAFQCPNIKRVDRVKVYSKRFDYRANYGSLKRVHLENLDYDNKYDTYSQVAHDAFYLLTPQVMERIMRLGEKYPNFAIHVCGKMVYVGVDNLRDSIDPPLHRSLDYVDVMQKIKEDVQVIKDVVDILELMPSEEKPL